MLFIAGEGKTLYDIVVKKKYKQALEIGYWIHVDHIGRGLATEISAALVERGIAVLRFDFTGLGESEGDFGGSGFSSNVDDLVAAAEYLEREWEAPALLIGHSLGGAAVLGMVPEPEANRLAMLPLALFLPLAVFGFVAGLVAVFGGVAALNRRRWSLAVAGAIAAIFGFFPVGIAAVIFTVLAEPEFRRAAAGEVA